MARPFPPPLPRKSEPSSPSPSPALPSGARRNAPPIVKSEHLHAREEENHFEDRRMNMEKKSCSNGFIVKNGRDVKDIKTEPEQGIRERAKRLRLLPGLRMRRDSLTAEHRRRLDALLICFMRKHRWKEAAGVLAVLLKWAPSAYNASEDDMRRYHTVAMELHRRFFGDDDRRYSLWIKQIYDIWMSRFSRTESDSRKKNGLMMELALFHFTQGKVDEAYGMMQFVIQDCDLEKESSVNLLYGMILYQIWYSGLPEQFKITSSKSSTPTETCGFGFNDGFQEMEMGASSNNHYAEFTEDAKFSFQHASESSFRNEKGFRDYNNKRPKAEFGVAPPQEFYGSHSSDKNKQRYGVHDPDNNLRNSSIFFARGLDTSLLPIRLGHLTGHVDQDIYQYRSLANQDYTDAVKYLRLALRSIRPVYAALLPLIQLLLLGDRVEEAFEELETSCHNMDTAQPFRLMARLLECFQSKKVTHICNYYVEALKRDPTCEHSLERLVKIHKSGNCSTMLLFEMIALHLDAASGLCSIWEELASCFLRLQTIALCDYEDCTSNNLRIGETNTISSSKIPTAFMQENARASWKLRFAWWKRHHFSISSLSGKDGGYQKMLCFKAACASHLYGPTYEYVIRASKGLRDEGSEYFSVLKTHMQKAMNMFEHL